MPSMSRASAETTSSVTPARSYSLIERPIEPDTRRHEDLELARIAPVGPQPGVETVHDVLGRVGEEPEAVPAGPEPGGIVECRVRVATHDKRGATRCRGFGMGIDPGEGDEVPVEAR